MTLKRDSRLVRWAYCMEPEQPNGLLPIPETVGVVALVARVMIGAPLFVICCAVFAMLLLGVAAFALIALGLGAWCVVTTPKLLLATVVVSLAVLGIVEINKRIARIRLVR